MEEKSIALVIFGLVAVVAVIGLVLVSSGEKTGRFAGGGGPKVYSGGAQQAGSAQAAYTSERYLITKADTLNQPTGDVDALGKPENWRQNVLPLLEGDCESHSMVSIESPREAESRGLNCPAMTASGELCCKWESRVA